MYIIGIDMKKILCIPCRIKTGHKHNLGITRKRSCHM